MTVHYKAGIIAFVFLISSASQGYADIIYLKNGRKVEGILKRENDENVELNIGFGIVGFNKKEIERIEKSSSQEQGIIREKWVQQRIESARKWEEQKTLAEAEPKKVEIFEENGQLAVETLLNRKVTATLIFDTGASTVMLLPSVAKKLGLDTLVDPNDKTGLLQCTLADGRKAQAKRVILETMSVKGMEVENVEAAVLLNDVDEPQLKDGLLGMSFLKQFIFKIYSKNKKLILERVR